MGRWSRGDVLLDNARMAFKTSSTRRAGVLRGVHENCLVGKNEMDDEARVLVNN